MNIFLSSFVLGKEIGTYRKQLMGIAILMVLLYHQRWLYGGFFSFFHDYGEWGVDIFFFLSGIGIWHSLSHNDLKTYFKNRINRLFVPCAFVGVIKTIGIYFGIGNGVVKVKRLLSLDLWFIVAIVCFYCIAPFLCHCIKRWGWIVGIVCFFFGGLSMLPIVPFFPWAMTIGRFPAFVLGLLLGAKSISLSRITCFISILALLIAVFLPLHCACSYLAFCLSLPVVIALLCLFMSLLPNFIKKIFAMLGACSLDIYLWHEYLFAVVNNEVGYYVSLSCVLCVISFAITAIAVMISKMICSNIKILK